MNSSLPYNTSNFYNSPTGSTTEINPQFDDKGNSIIDFCFAGANKYGQSEKTILLLDDNDDSGKDASFIRICVDANRGEGYTTYSGPEYFGSVFN